MNIWGSRVAYQAKPLRDFFRPAFDYQRAFIFWCSIDHVFFFTFKYPPATLTIWWSGNILLYLVDLSYCYDWTPHWSLVHGSWGSYRWWKWNLQPNFPEIWPWQQQVAPQEWGFLSHPGITWRWNSHHSIRCFFPAFPKHPTGISKRAGPFAPGRSCLRGGV